MYADLCRADYSDFTGEISELTGAPGIVMDVRGYPQSDAVFCIAHLTDRPAPTPQFLVPIVTQPDGQGVAFADQGWPVRPCTPRLRARVAFLTDCRAISYAETLLGIVEGSRLGDIVGEPTAGTNGDVNPFVLPGGYLVRWTGLRVVKRDGSPHHGVGIQPTVPASRTVRGVAEGRDEVLGAAVRLLTGD
jgi:hypothetical protein